MRNTETKGKKRGSRSRSKRSFKRSWLLYTFATIGFCFSLYFLAGLRFWRMVSIETDYVKLEDGEFAEVFDYYADSGVRFGHRWLFGNGRGWTLNPISEEEFYKLCGVRYHNTVYDYWFYTVECEVR